MDSAAKSNSKLYSFEGFLLKIEEGIVFVTLTIVLLGIAVGVVHRSFIEGALIGIEEICVLAGVWMYFMGSCITTHQNTHIKGDIISLFIKNTMVKRYLDVAIKTATVLLLGYATYEVYLYIDQVMSIGVLTTGLKIPKVYFLSSMFVGFILMIFHELVGIARLMGRQE